ncbi:MAG TPA: pitrilysin family protein [Thermoplasmata archaeon]|nr:pitrilysin family protein [Thermoplasmata archaeon]
MPERADPRRVERTVTEAGLTVIRQPPPAGAGSFSATYVAPSGWAWDPPREEGTAAIAARLLTSGTERMDRVELARELDRNGATLGTQCDAESAEVTIWGPTRKFDRLFDLMAEVVQRPRFAADDLARTQRQVKERQLRELTQPESRAERELLRALYPPGHPYRESGIGTRGSVERIDPTRLRRFHRARWRSRNALLVVTGRPTLDAVVRSARARFAWSNGSAEFEPSRPLPKLRPPGSVVTVPLPGRTEVQLRVGGIGIPRSDPGFPPLLLANEVLGGRSISRLFQRVREGAGLAYHASSSVESMRWGGYWYAQAGTGPERLAKVIDLVRAELARMRSTDVPRSELDRIRRAMTGSIPLQLETTTGAHELAVEVAYFGLPDDFFVTWPDRIRAVRAHELRAAAEAVLDPDRAVTVWAGPSPGLKKVGYS